jgi:hypothetical protein
MHDDQHGYRGTASSSIASKSGQSAVDPIFTGAWLSAATSAITSIANSDHRYD